VYALVDYQGKPYSLCYLRTKDRKEVDFCLVNRDKLELMIEAKRSDSRPDRSILNFHNKYNVPGVQVVLHLKRERSERGIEVRRGLNYLKSLR
jgi:hypothetical protein